MIRSHKAIVEQEVEVIDAIICNRCGADTNQEGLIEQEICPGYESTILGDSNRFKFSLCESCIMGLFQEFLFPPLTSVSQGYKQPETTAAFNKLLENGDDFMNNSLMEEVDE